MCRGIRYPLTDCSGEDCVGRFYNCGGVQSVGVCDIENGYQYNYQTCNVYTGRQYGDPVCTSNCEDLVCGTGYTKNWHEDNSTCDTYTGSCTSDTTCSITWHATCDATGTKGYKCSDNTFKEGNDNSCTVSSSYTYYTCPSDYTPSGTVTADTTCTKTTTGTVSSIIDNSTKYYCPTKNNDMYPTQSAANEHCKNQCSIGTYYNNKCYDLR